MKKYYYILALATTFLAACNNEDNLSVNDTTPEGSQRITYIRVDANEDATTRGSVDGTTAAFTWNTGDKIAVYTTDGYKISNGLENTYNGTNAASFAFSDMTDAHRANFAVCPASLVWDGTNVRSGSATDYTSSSLKLTLPASYTLAEVQDDVSPTPMIATNVPEGKLSFKALCPLLRVTVNFIPKQTKRLEFDFNGKKVQGEFSLTSVEAGTTAIATSATTGTDDIITVTMADNTVWHDNLVVNLPVPTGTFDDMTVTAYDAVTAGNALLKITQPIKLGGWTPTRKASRKMTASLPVFSVSSTKKVIFSPGNLRYTSGAWSFFDNQWDYYTTYSAGSLDKFGWSTSTTYGMSASTTGDYSGNFVDWGNTIGPGWRTLTSDEWTYLFKTRSASTVNSTQNARYAKAYLFGTKHGVILFPDSYTHPDGVAAPTGINATNSTSWNANSYSAADWAKMEVAGCVFLPAAGNRNEASINNAGSYGFYWSSSPYATDVSKAYSMNFAAGDLYPAKDHYRYYGFSVRLVRSVE